MERSRQKFLLRLNRSTPDHYEKSHQNIIQAERNSEEHEAPKSSPHILKKIQTPFVMPIQRTDFNATSSITPQAQSGDERSQ